MKRVLLLCCALAAGHPAGAQHMATALRAGSAGYGGDVVFPISSAVQIRAGGTMAVWHPGRASERFGVQTESTGDIRLGAFGVTLDALPFTDWLRLSLGLWSPVTAGSSRIVPVEGMRISDTVISKEDLGEVEISLRVSQSVAPYAGIGIGNPLGSDRIAVLLDVGVLYQGRPEVQVTATGRAAPTAGWEPVLQDSLQPFVWYPVVQIGLAVNW